MDSISESETWLTVTEETWLQEAVKLQEIFFKNPAISELTLNLPTAFGYKSRGPYFLNDHLTKDKRLNITLFSDIASIPASKFDTTVIKPENKSGFTFTKLVFRQQCPHSIIALSQELPPVKYQDELSVEHKSLIDLSIEYTILPTHTILYHYMTDLRNIEKRLKDFLIACGIFNALYCTQPYYEIIEGIPHIVWR